MKNGGVTNLGFEIDVQQGNEVENDGPVNEAGVDRKSPDDMRSRRQTIVHDFRYKVFKTVFMVLGPCAMGIYLELSGPTLIALKSHIGADYEEISRVLVARSIGYLLGSLSGGVLADIFTGDLEILLSTAFYLGAVGTGLVTWCPNLWSMGLMFHLQGLGEGLIDTVNNMLCLRMWGRQAAAPIHALHFGFGCGAILAPQLARPFINSRENTEGETSGDPPQIEIPYSISSFITFFFCLAFAVFYFFEKYLQHKYPNEECSDKKRRKKSVKEKLRDLFSPASCTGGRLLFGTFFFMLMFALYMNIVGGERAVSKFLYSYAIKKAINPLDSTEATSLNSAFWFSFTAGRAITIVASKWLSPGRLAMVELMGNILAASLLLLASLWAPESNAALWAGVCVLGLSMSPVFPTCLSWANVHVRVTGMAVAWVFAGSATGGAVYHWLSGYLFEYHGPPTLLYVLFGYAWLLTAVFLALLLLMRYKGGPRAEMMSLYSETPADADEDTAPPVRESKDASAQAWPWELKMAKN